MEREMERESAELSVRDLRGALADVLNDAAVHGKVTYVTSRGRRVAAMVTVPLAEAAEAAGGMDRAAGILRAAAAAAPAAAPVPGRTAAERAAGYQVTARCALTHGAAALLELPGEALPARWPAADVAAQAGITVRDLPGAWLELMVRESPEEGRVLSGFRLAAVPEQ